jgi:prepilin-type N-terminal cleavage/methylation domain-containing protein
MRPSVSTRRHPAISRGACAQGFTLTELLVVIAIIGLILGIGLPAFSRMSADSRFASATQQVNGVVSRASITALSQNSLAAVRFVPAAWDVDPNGDPKVAADAGRLAGRQRAISYVYGFTAQEPTDPNLVKLREFFQREERGPEVLLPADVWVAPIEALSDGNPALQPAAAPYGNLENILNGVFGQAGSAFSWSWRPGVTQTTEQKLGGGPAFSSNNDFLDADDFTVVFDGGRGVKRGAVFGLNAESVVLYGQNPLASGAGAWKMTTLERRGFSGVVMYRREVFAAQGNVSDGATAQARQDVLLREGRPYYMKSGGGGLVSGVPR